jgi:phage baseplate assembly protein W
MTKLYNQKSVANNIASVGKQGNLSHTYKGFSSNEAKTGFKLYDIDLVKKDLINHLYIRKGEKLQNPEFGTVIWDILFEPMTEDVKKIITQDIEQIINYDPRLIVNSVSIDNTDMGIRIEAEVVYVPFNVTERMSFDFDRNNSIIN